MSSRRRTHVSLVAAGLLFSATAAHGQPLSSPPTQDEQLRYELGLGNNVGCFTLLGLDTNDGAVVDQTLVDLGAQIGNELRAICGSSQVNSASSVGGGLNSLQATKTVSQFRLVRRRIDQRLQRGQPKPPNPSMRGFFQAPGSAGRTYADTPFEASGLFGEFEYEWRDRVDTPYESGYESRVRGVSIGLDRMFGTAVVGGWVSFSGVDADLTGSGVLIASPFQGTQDDAFRDLMSDPDVLSRVCGGSPQPGTLEQDTTRVGGYVGSTLGRAGFIDGSVSWARRTHDYSRGVCSIENQGNPAFQRDVAFRDLNANGLVDSAAEVVADVGGGVLFNDDDNNGLGPNDRVFDDIFAGTLSGDTRLHEFAFSVRAGADVVGSGWTGGPRAILTYTRATTDAFAETGRSTVANDVLSNSGDLVHRAIGGPVGLELAFDEQSRYSLLLELGGELGRQFGTRFGSLVPFGSAYYRHEFNDERTILTAHMAQDFRSIPARFPIGTDAPDAHTALVAGGLSAIFGSRLAVRAELRKLLFDDLFDATVFAAQARLRF